MTSLGSRPRVGRSASRSGSRATHEAADASSPKASIPNADEFHIWERLLLAVQKEIRDDEDGICRNLAHIADLRDRNEWLGRRLEQNRLAASAIEARRAATGNTDAVADESAIPKGDAQHG